MQKDSTGYLASIPMKSAHTKPVATGGKAKNGCDYIASIVSRIQLVAHFARIELMRPKRQADRQKCEPQQQKIVANGMRNGGKNGLAHEKTVAL